MIHDPDLIDRLASLPRETFAGEAFRATRVSLDPRALSTRAGRWGRGRALHEPGARRCARRDCFSLEPIGAIAFEAGHAPSAPPLDRPDIAADPRAASNSRGRPRSVRRVELRAYARDWRRYCVSRLRWSDCALGTVGCDNLMLFSDNQLLDCDLDVLASEEVDWLAWGRDHGIIS